MHYQLFLINNYTSRIYATIYYNKDRRVFIYLFIYLFRVTLSVISMGENSCPTYCRYRFKYLRK